MQQPIAFPTADDIQYAKSVARRMFETYDRDHSNKIEDYEVKPMIQDAYQTFNKVYDPTPSDVRGYAKVLDQNVDGDVTLSDLETLCIKYLVGENGLILSNNIASGYVNNPTTEEIIKKTASPAFLRASLYSPDTIRDSSPVSIRASRVYDNSASPVKNIEIERRTYNRSVTPVKSYDPERKPIDVAAILKRSALLVENVKKSSVLAESIRKSTILANDLRKSAVGGESLKRSSVNPEALKRSSVLADNLKKSSILADYIRKSAVLNDAARVDSIKRVFDKYDTNKDGFIDQQELKVLMEATYNYLGVAKVISSSDIQSYLAMVDTNRDGLISFPEYETIVVKCLAKHNIRL